MSTLVICRFCSGRSFLFRGSLRPVTTGILPEVLDEGTYRKRVGQRLREASIAQIADLEVKRCMVHYFMRRGLVRSRTRGIESVREGLFGLPLAEDSSGELLFLPDAKDLLHSDISLPEDLSSLLLRFEDRISQALEHASHVPLGTQGDGVVHAGWTDDLFLVTFPAETWSFTSPDVRDTLWHSWSGTQASGRYSITCERYSGQLLARTLPQKGPSWLSIGTRLGRYMTILLLPMFLALFVGMALVMVIVLGAIL